MNNLERFYKSFIRLETYTEKRRLFGATPVSKLWWPTRGVYYFLDNNEKSIISGFPMIVRVGTHAIRIHYNTLLKERLSQHWGKKDGGGDHRSSRFRGDVGISFIVKNNLSLKYPKWRIKENNGATPETKAQELLLEQKVSEYIRNLGILVLDIEDWQVRKYMEINSIAFLSSKDVLKNNPISSNWLGNYCIQNGDKLNYQLWNREHCGDNVDNKFFDNLDKYVDTTIKKWGKLN